MYVFVFGLERGKGQLANFTCGRGRVPLKRVERSWRDLWWNAPAHALPRLFIFSTLPYRRDFSIAMATTSLPFACASTSFVCQWTLTWWNHHLRLSSILFIRQVIRSDISSAHPPRMASCKLVTASSLSLLANSFLHVAVTWRHHRLSFLQSKTLSDVIGFEWGWLGIPGCYLLHSTLSPVVAPWTFPRAFSPSCGGQTYYFIFILFCWDGTRELLSWRMLFPLVGPALLLPGSSLTRFLLDSASKRRACLSFLLTFQSFFASLVNSSHMSSLGCPALLWMQHLDLSTVAE